MSGIRLVSSWRRRRLHTEKPEVSGSSARKKMMSGAA
ncbi:hypothetical protein NAEX_00422 [Nannocystis exedens]|nr:hypothetical protein NAEX_00422 [Nannocystis exedens]